MHIETGSCSHWSGLVLGSQLTSALYLRQWKLRKSHSLAVPQSPDTPDSQVPQIRRIRLTPPSKTQNLQSAPDNPQTKLPPAPLTLSPFIHPPTTGFRSHRWLAPHSHMLAAAFSHFLLNRARAFTPQANSSEVLELPRPTVPAAVTYIQQGTSICTNGVKIICQSI